MIKINKLNFLILSSCLFLLQKTSAALAENINITPLDKHMELCLFNKMPDEIVQKIIFHCYPNGFYIEGYSSTGANAVRALACVDKHFNISVVNGIQVLKILCFPRRIQDFFFADISDPKSAGRCFNPNETYVCPDDHMKLQKTVGCPKLFCPESKSLAFVHTCENDPLQGDFCNEAGTSHVYWKKMINANFKLCEGLFKFRISYVVSYFQGASHFEYLVKACLRINDNFSNENAINEKLKQIKDNDQYYIANILIEKVSKKDKNRIFLSKTDFLYPEYAVNMIKGFESKKNMVLFLLSSFYYKDDFSFLYDVIKANICNIPLGVILNLYRLDKFQYDMPKPSGQSKEAQAALPAEIVKSNNENTDQNKKPVALHSEESKADSRDSKSTEQNYNFTSIKEKVRLALRSLEIDKRQDVKDAKNEYDKKWPNSDCYSNFYSKRKYFFKMRQGSLFKKLCGDLCDEIVANNTTVFTHPYLIYILYDYVEYHMLNHFFRGDTRLILQRHYYISLPRYIFAFMERKSASLVINVAEQDQSLSQSSNAKQIDQLTGTECIGNEGALENEPCCAGNAFMAKLREGFFYQILLLRMWLPSFLQNLIDRYELSWASVPHNSKAIARQRNYDYIKTYSALTMFLAVNVCFAVTLKAFCYFVIVPMILKKGYGGPFNVGPYTITFSAIE